MSTRTIKVLELLEVLGKHEYHDSEGYVPISELEKKLNTTARNIRDIVRTLKNTKYEIESQPGKKGGYRFKPGILRRFFDLSQSDLRALENAKLYDVAEALEPPDNKRVKKVLNKLTLFDEQDHIYHDPYNSSRLSYDIHYLNYLHMMRSDTILWYIEQSMLHDLTMDDDLDSEDIEEIDKYPNYLYYDDRYCAYISYASPKESFAFKGIYFSELNFENEITTNNYKDHVLIMLDLDTKHLRLIELKYIRYSKNMIMEDKYYDKLDKYINIVNSEEYHLQSQRMLDNYVNKNYLVVNFSDNLSEKDLKFIKDRIEDICRIIIDHSSGDKIFLIHRMKLGLIHPYEIKIVEDSMSGLMKVHSLFKRYVKLLKIKDSITLDIVDDGMQFDEIDEYSIDDPE